MNTKENSKPFRVEVQTEVNGSYAGNNLTFETIDEAKTYGYDLYSRWMLVKNWRVIDADNTQKFVTEH